MGLTLNSGGLSLNLGSGLSLTGDDDDNTLSMGGGGPDEDENPLEGVDIEAEAAGEIGEALRKFKERAQAADQRFVDNTDSEFWFCIGFQNRAQKEEFLTKLGLIDLGDKYLDGVEVARALGIKLETPMPEMPKFGHDTRLEILSPEFGEGYKLPGMK